VICFRRRYGQAVGAIAFVDARCLADRFSVIVDAIL
jgi:hypothetical protein